MKPGPIPKKCTITSLRTSSKNAPQFIAPECPSHLHGEARAEWDRISVMLEKYRLVTEVDTAALALYCAAYGRWKDAEKRIEEIKKSGGDGMIIKSPTGYPIQNPYLAIANRAMEDTYKYLQQFGLSPAARTRVDVPVMGTLDLDFGEEKSTNYFT